MQREVKEPFSSFVSGECRSPFPISSAHVSLFFFLLYSGLHSYQFVSDRIKMLFKRIKPIGDVGSG